MRIVLIVGAVFPPLPTALVRVLLGACRPLAVLGRVRTIVVHAFKLQTGRAWTHVRDKGGKAVQPFIAHVDPAGSVVLVARVVRILTAGLGGGPSSVFASTKSLLPRVPMNLSLAGRFNVEAATTFRPAVHKTGGVHRPLCTAFAAANPSTYSSAICVPAHDGPPPITAPRPINEGWHLFGSSRINVGKSQREYRLAASKTRGAPCA
jgi:hypothetical protein